MNIILNMKTEQFEKIFDDWLKRCKKCVELRRENITFTTVDVVERQDFFLCSGCEFLLIFKLTEYNYLSMYCDKILYN